jgi:hypothetical protein
MSGLLQAPVTLPSRLGGSGTCYRPASRGTVSSDYEALRSEAELRLVEFIFGELKMGATWVRKAKIAKETGDVHHYDQAKDKAQEINAMVGGSWI